MFWQKSQKSPLYFTGKAKITLHNPNKPHGPELQVVRLRQNREYARDDLFSDIGIELPDNMTSVHLDVFNCNLDDMKYFDIIMVATTNGQIDYSDEPVWLNIRAGKNSHNQDIKAAPEYDLNIPGYIPSATHIIGALVNNPDGWRYVELDLYRPERLQDFMTRLNSSHLSLSRFKHVIAMAQQIESSSHATDMIKPLLSLPWMNPKALTSYMEEHYKPAIFQMQGESVMQDLQIAWDPLLRYSTYLEAAKTMLQDGAPWWPKSLAQASQEERFDQLLEAKPISPNWVKLVLSLAPKADLMHYCSTPNKADAVYDIIKKAELIPLLSSQMKRNVLTDDLSL
jgi:hypothetical protein